MIPMTEQRLADFERFYVYGLQDNGVGELITEIRRLQGENAELKSRGIKLVRESTPWAEYGSALDCATNRNALKHKIDSFMELCK